MKQLIKVSLYKLGVLRNSLRINTGHDCGTVVVDTAQDKLEKLKSQQNQRLHQNIPDTQVLGSAAYLEKPIQYKQACLFPDGKTNKALLSLIIRGVATILAQKKNLPWKAEASKILSYEEVDSDKGAISYYVTDNPESPQPDILVEEVALNVIDQFDPRACAIHLIYCALLANLDKPWEESFVISDKQLLECTGLIKRRDLSKHEQLSILYKLLRQPAQILARLVWSQQEKPEDSTATGLKIWNITVLRDYQTDKAGNPRLIALKVTGRAGTWAKYFLNKSGCYDNTGLITKKTVQKLFSIGKQNVGAARMLVWLTFQIQPHTQESVMGKTLMEIAYGADKVAIVEQDRQLRRQMADDFETDLKVVKDAGWQIELNQGSVWLKSNNRTKRPIGYWKELLNSTWYIQLPIEVNEYLISKKTETNLTKQVPTGKLIREARKSKGWSRTFFAKIMGKSISWVDAVETGHRQVSQKDLPKLINELELF